MLPSNLFFLILFATDVMGAHIPRLDSSHANDLENCAGSCWCQGNNLTCQLTDTLDSLPIITSAKDRSLITKIFINHQQNFRTLSEDQLKFYPNLKKLIIKKTGLHFISPNAFQFTLKLTRINIQHNQIKFLPKETFKGLKLRRLYINSNPIICNCSAKWIQELANSDKSILGTLRNKITCNDSKNTTSKFLLKNVILSDCDQGLANLSSPAPNAGDWKTSIKISQILTFLNTALILMLVITTAFFVKWRKYPRFYKDLSGRNKLWPPRFRNSHRTEKIPLAQFGYALNPIYSSTAELIAGIPYIDEERINVLKFLGEGHFGEVSLGTVDNLTEEVPVTFVAMKGLKESNPSSKKEFKKEVELVADLWHTNIVEFFGISRIDGRFVMIFEYMEFGDLNHFLSVGRLLQRLNQKASVVNNSDVVYTRRYQHKDIMNTQATNMCSRIENGTAHSSTLQ